MSTVRFVWCTASTHASFNRKDELVLSPYRSLHISIGDWTILFIYRNIMSTVFVELYNTQCWCLRHHIQLPIDVPYAIGLCFSSRARRLPRPTFERHDEEPGACHSSSPLESCSRPKQWRPRRWTTAYVTRSHHDERRDVIARANQVSGCRCLRSCASPSIPRSSNSASARPMSGCMPHMRRLSSGRMRL